MSHRMFVLRLMLRSNSGGTRVLDILCEGCDEIQGPLQWKNVHLTVTEELGLDGLSRMKISDAESGFRVLCRRVSTPSVIPRDVTPGRRTH